MCSLLTVHRISLSAVRSSRSCTRNLAQLEKVKCTSLKNFKGFIFTQSLMNTTTTNDTSVHVNGMSSKLSLDAARALEVYNKTLGRKSLSPDGIYILHTDVAERLAQYIPSCVIHNNVTLFEINPGPGILTRVLLACGVEKIKLFEPKKEFIANLLDIQRLHINKIELIETNFFNISKLALRDKLRFSNEIDNMFSGVLQRPWDDESPSIVIVGIPPPNKEAVFLRYLPAALTGMQSLFSYGRAQLLLFISHKEYQHLLAKPKDGFQKYRSISIMYQVFFDVELLYKEDRSNFFPAAKMLLAKKFQHYDQKHLYLVRITPKKELLSLFPSSGQLRELYYFIKQNSFKRKGFVISKLENWIPDCGIRLIKMGFTIFTRFGDLEPHEFLQLFQEFSSWPEYPTCSFRLAMSKTKHLFDELSEQEDEDCI